MAPKRRFPRQGIVVMGYCPIARAQKFGKYLVDLNIHETASQCFCLNWRFRFFGSFLPRSAQDKRVFDLVFTKTSSGRTRSLMGRTAFNVFAVCATQVKASSPSLRSRRYAPTAASTSWFKPSFRSTSNQAPACWLLNNGLFGKWN